MMIRSNARTNVLIRQVASSQIRSIIYWTYLWCCPPPRQLSCVHRELSENASPESERHRHGGIASGCWSAFPWPWLEVRSNGERETRGVTGRLCASVATCNFVLERVDCFRKFRQTTSFLFTRSGNRWLWNITPREEMKSETKTMKMGTSARPYVIAVDDTETWTWIFAAKQNNRGLTSSIDFCYMDPVVNWKRWMNMSRLNDSKPISKQRAATSITDWWVL